MKETSWIALAMRIHPERQFFRLSINQAENGCQCSDYKHIDICICQSEKPTPCKVLEQHTKLLQFQKH